MPSESRIAINSAASHSGRPSARASSPSRRNSSPSSLRSFADRLANRVLPGDEEEDPMSEDPAESGEAMVGIDERENNPPASAFQVLELPPEQQIPPNETPPLERPKMESHTSTASSRHRFQSAVKKVTTTQALSGAWQDRTREPGIDPRRVDLPNLKNEVVLQCVQFSKDDADFAIFANDNLQPFLDYLADSPPEWSKVRWIHANGLSWDVIKPIALKYDLHPLSLEDMLYHGAESSSRSKADYYKQHLFVSAVVHKTLHATAAEDDLGSLSEKHADIVRVPGSHLREQFGFFRDHQDEEVSIESRTSLIPTATVQPSPAVKGYKMKLRRTFTHYGTRDVDMTTRSLTNHTSGLASQIRRRMYHQPSKHAEREAARCTVSALTRDVKVHVHVENLSIFLLRNGTIISFTQDTGYHSRFSAIFDRIGSVGDLIRESEDPSFILQALLDVVGDHALDIVDDFREQITKLEARVLASPDMGDVRHLHILSAQLLLLKSTLSPFLQLLQGIRMQDDAKAAAAIKPSAEQLGKKMGFVSHEAKVYLGDVMDHIESVLSALDLFSSLSENLISYTFNNLSYSSNAYMQALSVLSVIFLPLTFLSGYFGMNFASFPAALNGDVSFFWKIAIPVSVVTTLLFSFSYIREMVRSAGRELVRLRHRWEQTKKMD